MMQSMKRLQNQFVASVLGSQNLVSHVSSFQCERMEFHRKAGNRNLRGPRGVLSRDRDIVCRHGQGKTCTAIHLYWIRFLGFVGLSTFKTNQHDLAARSSCLFSRVQISVTLRKVNLRLSRSGTASAYKGLRPFSGRCSKANNRPNLPAQSCTAGHIKDMFGPLGVHSNCQ